MWERKYLGVYIFIDQLIDRDIPYLVFNKIVVGYDPDYIIRGFNVLDERKSDAIFNSPDFMQPISPKPISPEEYEDTLMKKRFLSNM